MGQVDRIAEPWGSRTPYAPGESWPLRVDTHLVDELTADQVDSWVQSASVLNSSGDALDIALKNGRIVGVRGRVVDRVNHGRLDPKDLYGWQATTSPDRLTRPMIRRGGRLEETDWDTAMDLVVARTRQLLAEQGPSAIGFFASGQLFLEEYYTLGVIARGGIGTNHIDASTRLGTATAAQALQESFGCDGQPGSYTDIDHADVIALYGHNMAETHTVLWSRVLDRLAGQNPPALLCVDPRHTPVARAATVHLAPRPGTNLALMNGLLHEILRNGWVDQDYISAYTLGFEELERLVAAYPPAQVARICDVPPEHIREAAQLLGTAKRLLSTVAQGFYQSHQATAAAVQVNNVHLVRGMLGRPGCGILHMNGQPSAQNTRECGIGGDLPGFRNWANPRHVEELARLWNVDPTLIPHYGAPTHLMQMLRYAEEGSLRMLWVCGANPVVSLPELARIRRILSSEHLFLVVQDIFPSETTELADVVLPAATWGEKTGTFTNSDRTVHLSDKAVDPPGQARPDLDIFLDYARRLNLRDADGQPLVKWRDAEGAFEAWKACSAGRPCDYSGLSYTLLRGSSGIQWPCTASAPEGTEHLYINGAFWSHPDYCESYGRDLVTGAPVEPAEYRALNPSGRALIKAAEYLPPHEVPSPAYPFYLITGRTLSHFQTRTRTGRVDLLQTEAPQVWVEMSVTDAAERNLIEGDLLEIITPRGRVEARLRIGGVRPGVLFLPFHYGYWDVPEDQRPPNGPGRAANELTPTDWDPVSRQPLFKTGVAEVALLRRGPSPYRDALFSFGDRTTTTLPVIADSASGASSATAPPRAASVSREPSGSRRISTATTEGVL